MKPKTMKELDLGCPYDESCPIINRSVTKEGAIAWLVYSLKKKRNPYESIMEFHNITPDEISEAMK